MIQKDSVSSQRDNYLYNLERRRTIRSILYPRTYVLGFLMLWQRVMCKTLDKTVKNSKNN